MTSLSTPRLLLRRWRAEDREPFYRINSDPRVMEHFPACLTRAESDAAIDRMEAHFKHHGFGLWAAELVQTGELAGFIGLSTPRFTAHFTPCVEVGWRLSVQFWGRDWLPRAPARPCASCRTSARSVSLCSLRAA